ncbi:MAG: hypothetical protein COA78_12235 [Blastopirellula sp.]|nr:MAG: hypothetical protein COA78_12235 [Blastopirellula sp.]
MVHIKKSIEIRSATLVFWILLGLLICLAMVFIGCAVERQMPSIALFALIPAFLAPIPWYFATYPWLILKLTPDGFYTREHKLHVPWNMVQRVELINVNKRVSEMLQVASPVGGNRRDRFVIGIEFRPQGKAELGERLGISGMKTKFYPTENMILSTLFLEVHGTGFRSNAELVKEMQRRSSSE